MSSDYELLGLAAKAAGYHIVGYVEKYIAQPSKEQENGLIIINRKGGDSAWNPLKSMGDALRLAVALGLGVNIYRKFAFSDHSRPCVEVRGYCYRSLLAIEYASDNEDSLEEAVCRAIVCAAAEIGKLTLE